MASLDAELITDLDRLEALAPAWDELAVACRRPLTAPAWALGGWRRLQPDAELRVVAVRDGEQLVALAPFCLERKGAGRVDLRLLMGGMMPRNAPLALPGREWEAAGPIAEALAGVRPQADVVALEAAPLASHWPTALADRWPGPLRPATRRYFVQPSPIVSLSAGSLDGWFAGKSQHFRKRMRKLRRTFAEQGGSVRASTQETVREDVAIFMRLHAMRWEGKGESSLVRSEPELSDLYEEIARIHLDAGRFRLYLLELDGEPIAAELFAAAGGELVSINGGFDERHAKLGPSHLTIMHAMEEAFAHGDARLDLGPGDQHFKQRFGDGDDPVCWTLLLVPRKRMPLTMARVTPTLARIRTRDALKRALPPEQLERVRGLRQRLG